MAKIPKAPEMKERLAAQGAEVYVMPPDEFSAFIRREKERWAKVVKDANVKATDLGRDQGLGARG